MFEESAQKISEGCFWNLPANQLNVINIKNLKRLTEVNFVFGYQNNEDEVDYSEEKQRQKQVCQELSQK